MAYNLTATSITAAQIATALTTLAHAGTESALTAQQITALQNEINNNPNGMPYKPNGTLVSHDALCQILNIGSYVANPVTSAPRITLDALTQDQVEVIRTTLDYAKSIADKDGTPVSAEMNDIITETLPAAAAMKGLDMTLDTTKSMLADIQSSGLLTANQITELTTIADPTWSAQVWKDGWAIANAAGLFISPSDLTAAGF